jgi:hypothetical protein
VEKKNNNNDRLRKREGQEKKNVEEVDKGEDEIEYGWRGSEMIG